MMLCVASLVIIIYPELELGHDLHLRDLFSENLEPPAENWKAQHLPREFP